ncbi:hypothetical protein NPIL_75411, partial [Nephila pilipes]
QLPRPRFRGVAIWERAGHSDADHGSCIRAGEDLSRRLVREDQVPCHLCGVCLEVIRRTECRPICLRDSEEG